MLVAIALHGVALYWIRWERSAAPLPAKSLEVLLRSPPSEPSMPVAVTPEFGRTGETLNEQVETELSQPLEEMPADEAVLDSIESIRASIRRRLESEDQPHYRTFSTNDFPRAAKPADPFSRPPTLQRSFVHRAEVVEYTDAEGNLVVRRVDAWGRVICAKQIHFAGDGNGPLWHVFPPGTTC